MKKLPPIMRETMVMKINDQIEVVLFPEKNGQPQIDSVQVCFTEVEGKKTSIYMTPCEALEIASGLSSAAQFYLYNQEQYREEVLEPRIKLAVKRSKICKVCKGKKQVPNIKRPNRPNFPKTIQCPACKGSGKQSNLFKDESGHTHRFRNKKEICACGMSKTYFDHFILRKNGQSPY